VVEGSEVAEARQHHHAERLSHALYGLIIVTATLVAEKEHLDDPIAAMGGLLGIALVLILAHTYSAWMAERTVDKGRLGAIGRRFVVMDNLPVAAAIVVPFVLFAFAWLSVLSLQSAYVVSIGFSLIALVGVGVFQAREASMRWPLVLLSGAVAAAIGVVVIAVEAFFD
jgi:hypothetical protein